MAEGREKGDYIILVPLPQMGKGRDGVIKINNRTEKSRQLRKNMTSQERKLWSIIRNRQFFGYRFRRQFPIGHYIVDFVSREKKIIIEIDGGQHNERQNIEYDKIRTGYLKSEGYRVIRFWNNEIDNNIDGVYEKLKEIFEIGDQITPSQPSPSGEGGKSIVEL